MKCPRDGAELTTVRIGDVEIDKCHHCDGLWFDQGELDRVRKLDRTEVEERLEQQYGSPEVAAGEVKGYMRCPRCSEGRLQEFTYTYGNRVRIDRCNECLGMWVDDKELDAILGEQKQLEKLADDSKLKAFMRAMSNLLTSR
ncbi:zf-TFIIB domain-containing protein [Aeoliella sp. ICT_H6.2]|uniref:Zf-TFIIB domain-containing protein n=1 Tax=Aeoliella straminimaris TaxID=2954799 RepID=A0A9X2F9P7_9BACT|nr:zf-TFIIB domain-containing protein [Aeoliella straminimaris]MCO6042334.1 zf-TFIIB domain-containing protein [Aeoliella straminimaris]